MDRRSFVRFDVAATAAGVIVPVTSFAVETMNGAGGIYYTKDQLGRWAKKAGGHVPHINLQKNGSESIVEIITPHEMNKYEHYIVKHILLDQDYQFIAEHMFDPSVDMQARSEFKLDDYHGTVFALSVCNVHDTWLSMTEV